MSHKLVGIWKEESRVTGGVFEPGKRLICFGEWMHVVYHNRVVTYEYEALDTDPAQLTIVLRKKSHVRILAIYQIDEDKLQMCSSSSINPTLPTEFRGDGVAALSQLKRAGSLPENLTHGYVRDLHAKLFGPAVVPISRRFLKFARHSNYDWILKHIESKRPNSMSIVDIVGMIGCLDREPPGYVRCFSMFFVDAHVQTAGFQQLFNLRYGPLIPHAIAGFERVGEGAVADLLKLAVAVCVGDDSELAKHNGFSDLDAVPVPLSLDELTDQYNQSVGSSDDEVPFSLPAIDSYSLDYPQDF